MQSACYNSQTATDTNNALDKISGVHLADRLENLTYDSQTAGYEEKTETNARHVLGHEVQTSSKNSHDTSKTTKASKHLIPRCGTKILNSTDQYLDSRSHWDHGQSSAKHGALSLTQTIGASNKDRHDTRKSTKSKQEFLPRHCRKDLNCCCQNKNGRSQTHQSNSDYRHCCKTTCARNLGQDSHTSEERSHCTDNATHSNSEVFTLDRTEKLERYGDDTNCQTDLEQRASLQVLLHRLERISHTIENTTDTFEGATDVVDCTLQLTHETVVIGEYAERFGDHSLDCKAQTDTSGATKDCLQTIG